MKKILTVSLLVFLCVAVLFFSIASENLKAEDSECKNSSNGDTCIGECCKTTKTGCVAGPCRYIFPK